MADARAWALWVSVFGAASAALVTEGCLEPRADIEDRAVARCAGCHGDASREGSFEQRSAPPFDLHRNSSTNYPGVGSHEVHVHASDSHAAVACNECHIVPEGTGDPGHADTPLPAELTFGELATQGGRSPSYDFGTRRCSDTYCHSGTAPAWVNPRSSAEACGTCHGLPPPAPHPEADQCWTCHHEVVGRSGFVRPELHVDGTVQVETLECNGCHGDETSPAPPRDLSEHTSHEFLGVGAHQAHLGHRGSSRPLACNECHRVPEHPEDPGHFDLPPAEVRLRGVATTSGRDPVWNRDAQTCSDTWCHAPAEPGRASPLWTSGQTLACNACHGLPPPAPHPQMENCSFCHGDVIDADRTIIARERHVDGVVDVIAEPSCTSCHGSDNAAPPRDLSGDTEPTHPGVGAHQAHLDASSKARQLACEECHQVPENWLSPGHIDTTAPAEVIFSGVATAYGAQPVYENGSCRETFCHGGHFPGDHPSGGVATEPEWTRVDGIPASCGGCHWMPPPPPHPVTSERCSSCHRNIDEQNQFTRPDLHVDGDVTFSIPE